MTRWINASAAVIFTVASVLISFFSPPQLPLHYLPVAAVVVLAAMLIRQTEQKREIPQKHVEELHTLAGRLLEDIGRWRPIQFSPDAEQDAVLRESFQSHFPKVAEHLDRWTVLLRKDADAKAALSQAVGAETVRLQQEHGLDPRQIGSLLTTAANGELTNAPAPVAAFLIANGMASGGRAFGRVLFLGGSGIAESHSATADEDLAAAQQALTDATEDVADWKQLSGAKVALSALQADTKGLRHELLKIQHTHTLPKRCDLCPA